MLSVVDVELTPNPHAIKFVLNDRLLQFETRHFHSAEDAVNDPFAAGIFKLPGVVSVFYTGKFVTVEKTRDTDWGKIQRPFIEFLMNFDRSLIPEEKMPTGADAEASELMKKIYAVLNEKIIPALAYDGGGLEVIDLTGYQLSVRYQGACGSCPSATSGTLNAIQSLLRKEVDPNIEVYPA